MKTTNLFNLASSQTNPILPQNNNQPIYNPFNQQNNNPQHNT